MILLDTNAVIVAINRRIPSVRDRLEDAFLLHESIGISSVVIFELQYGSARSARPEANERELALFLTLPLDVIPFDGDDARAAGEVRAELERVGRPIGPYDVLIAGQARRRDAILVTANRSEFARVTGLRSEDWSLPSST
jgi:tRNA(fMet)-specific endonuclease VapC